MAPSGAEIHVASGVYRENSAGLGYLRLESPLADLAYIADGEVILQAQAPSACVMDIATAADPSFFGFTVHGADSCAQLVRGAPFSVEFRGCRFVCALIAGLDFTGGGGLIVDGCEFGTVAAPLVATAVRLLDCAAVRIADCDFFVVGAGVLLANRCGDLCLTANDFGCPEQPLDLGSQWAVFVANSDRVQVSDNALFLGAGHGLGFPAGALSITSATIAGNTLYSTSLANQYGIMVGSEAPVAIEYRGVEIAHNRVSLPIPVADTAKHDLFVGYTLQPSVHDNEIIGGGYGLVIKGNDGADVRDNSIAGTWRNGILDKAGWDCEFHGNSIDTARGRCARLCNDDAAGREVRGSRWYGNEYRGGAMAYEISAPVTPAANALSSDANTIQMSEHGDPLLVVLGGYQDLWTAQAAWDWDVTSALIATDEAPEPRGEDLQVGGSHALLRVDCSELCAGWLAYGTGELSDTLHVDAAEMTLAFALSELLPGTTYQYRYALIDSDGDSFLSAPASFTTEASSAAPPAALALFLGAIHPNPGRAGSRFTLQQSGERELDLALFSIQGRRLRTLHRGRGTPGMRDFQLDGKDTEGESLPAGIYLVRACDGQASVTRRWVLLR